MARSAPANPSDAPFEAAVVELVHGVRDAFARIIEYRCNGAKVVTALCEAFGIHRKLAWQVTKVAYSDDPFVAARHVPAGRSLAAWLDAASSAGVPRALVDAGRHAALRFDELASAHAASRAEFEMLLESCAGRSGAEDPEAHARWREQSFRGNSFVWGAHCRVLMAMMVLTPSDDVDGFFHCVQVRGLMGYRQTRAGVRWVVNQGVVTDDRANATSGVRRVPLDPDAAHSHGGVPVLPAYCSNPMPRLNRRVMAEGVVLDEFVAAGVGQSGERSLVTAEVARNIGPAHQTPRDTFAHFGTGVRIPAESLHFDLFVHRTLFTVPGGGGDRERELRVFSDLASPAASDDADALPVPERIAPLGRGVALAQTPDIPAYTDLALGVFQRLDADAGEYDLYRVRMAFPPMPVSVMIRLRLAPFSK
jgi:hypothetical protein